MSERVADFHALDSRLRLSGVLVTRTALRIGSGGGDTQDAADLPVLRDARRRPLIPGSSLKGVLRSTIEALLRGATLDPATGLWACDPHDEEEGSPERACGSHRAGTRASVDRARHCAACRLFGSRVVASHVRISDAQLLWDEESQRGLPLPIEVRDGVAIDRDLRVVSGAQKYDFEVVSAGSRFELEVFVENPRPWLLGLLAVGFEQIHEGFTALGGFTSRGLGRVEIRWTSLSRSTARNLLDGSPPEVVAPPSLDDEFARWRAALAQQARPSTASAAQPADRRA